MLRRTSLAALALAAGASLVVGCGASSSGSGGTNDSSQSPQIELTSAVSALRDASSLTSTIKLGASGPALVGLAAGLGDHLPAAAANVLAGAQIRIEAAAPSGKTLGDVSNTSTPGAASEVTIGDNGTDYLSVRSIAKTLYIHADLKDLFNTLGDGAAYAGLQQASAQLPAFVQAVVQGKWVSLDESSAQSLSGTTSGSGAATGLQARALVSALEGILAKDVTVTRTSTGSTDTLRLTANSRTVAKDLVSAVTTALPTAGAALGSADPSQVPNRTIILGAQVTGGALSQLSIDLGQFAPRSNVHLPLEIDLAEGGVTISAPSGAVAVSTQDLQQLLGSFAGGLTSGGLTSGG